jgi:DNA-binding response OmpR family regulator
MQVISKDFFVTEKKFNMPTILVVEDEPNVRKLVVVNLIKRGYQVLEAGSGRQALAYLHNQRPDLMILDVKLPDISGWEILDRLGNTSAIPADFPVLVMTASQVDQYTMLNQYPCVVEILLKPFNTDRLVAAIHRAL